MKKFCIRYFFAMAFALCLAFVVVVIPAYAQGSVPVPTVLSIQEGQSFSTGLPVIAGVTKNNTRVAVFIDGTLNGLARVVSDPSGTASFSYVPFLPLKPGLHTVAVQAEVVSTAERSTRSSVITLRIWDISAPTLIAPEDGVLRFDHPARAVITGLAKNGLTVNLHNDDVFTDHVKVKNHSSGTASFAIWPKVSPGTHTVFAASTDATGRISAKRSNAVTLVVEYPLPTPTIMSLKTSADAITVAGVAKNGSIVEVWIDGVKDGESVLKDDPSGTVWFSYTSTSLVAGDHTVVIVARDGSGKKSMASRTRIVSVGVAEQSPQGEKDDSPSEGEQNPEQNEPVDAEDEKQSSSQQETGEVNGETEQSPVDIDAGGDVATSPQSQEVSVQPMNWPLISGVVILAFLVIVFIVWYLRQKKELINKSIDRIFGETEGLKPDIPKERKNDEGLGGIVIKEKKSLSKEPPLPPPPPPPPPPPRP
ncbi:MAG TPA: hypothetical protein VJB93_04075 [Patescibacteria group bacterium]|nr:hypothetical protein [Patescibacteria group bacterium]